MSTRGGGRVPGKMCVWTCRVLRVFGSSHPNSLLNGLRTPRCMRPSLASPQPHEGKGSELIYIPTKHPFPMRNYHFPSFFTLKDSLTHTHTTNTLNSSTLMNIVERVMLLSDISCMPSFHLRWRSPLSSASVNTWISSATRHASMCIYIYISYYYPLLNEADYTFTCGAWQYLSGDADYNNLPIFPNVGDGWKTFPRGHLIYNFSSL